MTDGHWIACCPRSLVTRISIFGIGTHRLVDDVQVGACAPVRLTISTIAGRAPVAATHSSMAEARQRTLKTSSGLKA
jgi:hypothetical protein